MAMNPRRLAELIDRQGPALVLYARQWCGAPEDVVQEAFLKLIRQPTAPQEPVAWLYRVVRNGALDAAKAERRRGVREAAASRREGWFAEEQVNGLDAAAAVAALADLPLEQREAVVAHLWGGLRFEEIGALAGTAASTAYRRYAAGLAELRRRLGLPAEEEKP